MVPMIVVAGVIIGMITIVPSAMADRKDGSDDGKDWKICKKSFEKAFKDFKKHGFITPERRTLVNQCLSEGFESPWNLPKDELDDNRSPALSGLSVEFVESKIEIPVSPGSPLNAVEEIIEVYPCPAGEIVIGELLVLSVGSKTTMKFELQGDKTTLILKTTNKDTTPDTLVLLTPCLGLIGN